MGRAKSPHRCRACGVVVDGMKGLRAHFVEHPDCGDEIESQSLSHIMAIEHIREEDLDARDMGLGYTPRYTKAQIIRGGSK